MNIRLAGVAFCLSALSAPARGQEAERRALVHVTQTGPQAEAIKKDFSKGSSSRPGSDPPLFAGARCAPNSGWPARKDDFPISGKIQGRDFFRSARLVEPHCTHWRAVGFASLKPDGTGGKAEVFVEGWLNDKGAYDGRPVDVAQLPRLAACVGRLRRALYRITYEE